MQIFWRRRSKSVRPVGPGAEEEVHLTLAVAA
jgi:hypothetical protein